MAVESTVNKSPRARGSNSSPGSGRCGSLKIPCGACCLAATRIKDYEVGGYTPNMLRSSKSDTSGTGGQSWLGTTGGDTEQIHNLSTSKGGCSGVGLTSMFECCFWREEGARLQDEGRGRVYIPGGRECENIHFFTAKGPSAPTWEDQQKAGRTNEKKKESSLRLQGSASNKPWTGDHHESDATQDTSRKSSCFVPCVVVVRQRTGT